MSVSDTTNLNGASTEKLIKHQEEILSALNKMQEERIVEFVSNDMVWTIAGAVLGIVFTLFVTLGRRWINNARYKRLYKDYEGFYVSKIADDNSPHYILKLKRQRNEFHIKGVSVKKKINGELEKRHENLLGNIKMGESLNMFGVGQYQHKPDENGRIRVGEYRIQLAPKRKVIAIQHITDDQLKNYTVKYFWEPINEKDHESYLSIYNHLIDQ